MRKAMSHGRNTPHAYEDNKTLFNANTVNNPTRKEHPNCVCKLKTKNNRRIRPLIPFKFRF